MADEEKNRLYQRRYRERHREALRIAHKEYRKLHRDRINARNRAYYAANRDRILQRYKAYRTRNADRLREQARLRRRLKNPTRSKNRPVCTKGFARIGNDHPVTVAARASGFRSARSFCRACGILTTEELLLYVTGRKRVYLRDGSLSAAVRRICDVLCESPERLFPDQSRETLVPDARLHVRRTASQSHDAYDRGTILRVLSSVLSKSRMAVVYDRFFLGLTLEETGAKRGLTRERIRQIEKKALEKIGRTPRIIRMLLAHLKN